MCIDDTIRGYMKMKGKSATQVAKELGWTPQNFNKKLLNKTVKYSEADKVAKHLGYKIVWVEDETAKPPSVEA